MDQVRIKSISRERTRFARMTRIPWHIYLESLKQDADIYHFHDPELIPVGLLLRAHGKDVIYDLHEDYPKDILGKKYLPAWSRPKIAWLMRQVERASCIHFSALVTATPPIAERFRKTNSRTVVVHNYPCPNEVFPESSCISWETRKQAVAYVGGISGQRGIREMIAAIGSLPPSLAASLELAGPAPVHLHLEELYRFPGWERVHYHGLLDQPGIFRLLRNVRAGLVVLHPDPGYLESLPLKMFEYMAAGIPVIASDFPLWRRIIEGAGCGILVDPLDPSAIARAMEYVLKHATEAEAMGRRGRDAVQELYNWSTEAEKLLNLYHGLANPGCAS
jgi:glycosyltransferase involved in cell wall biosynthesis